MLGRFICRRQSSSKHLAGHLWQLALYTLPKLYDEVDEESDADSGKALMTTVKRQLSSNSDDSWRELTTPSEAEFEQLLKTARDFPYGTPFEVPDIQGEMAWDHIPRATYNQVIDHEIRRAFAGKKR